MLVFHNEIGELGPHLNLKPALGGRQIRGIEAAPTAARGSGEQGQSWRLLGEGKDSQEVNLREMCTLFNRHGPRTLTGPPDFSPPIPAFIKNAVYGFGQPVLAWSPCYLLTPWCPVGHLLEDSRPSGEAGLYLVGGPLSRASWGAELLK